MSTITIPQKTITLDVNLQDNTIDVTNTTTSVELTGVFLAGSAKAEVFTTEAALLAATRDDGTMAVANDTSNLYVRIDGVWVLSTSEGVVTGAENIGGGAELYDTEDSSGVISFRTLTGSGDVTVTQNATTIDISAVGESTTASNVGAGAGVFKQKTGDDLEFKSLTSATPEVSFTENASDVQIDVDLSAVDAATLDGLTSDQFLRSDTDDTFAGSLLTVSNDEAIGGELSVVGDVVLGVAGTSDGLIRGDNSAAGVNQPGSDVVISGGATTGTESTRVTLMAAVDSAISGSAPHAPVNFLSADGYENAVISYKELRVYDSLGVGVTSPASADVHVRAIAPVMLLEGTSGTANFQIKNNQGQWTIRENSGSHKLTIDDDTNARIGFEIDGSGNVTLVPSSGNVGIGKDGASAASLLDVDGTATATGVNVTSATASRLASFDGSKNLASADLASWISGTSLQISVADDGDGSVTLSLPQDIAEGSDVTFNSITGDGSGLTNVDATTVDGLNSDQFLRSDTSDSFTSGTLTIGTGANLLVTDATATRLAAFDASKNVSSTSLASWVSGTTSQISVSDDGDGTITLSTPQDIASTSDVNFASATLTGELAAATGNIGSFVELGTAGTYDGYIRTENSLAGVDQSPPQLFLQTGGSTGAGYGRLYLSVASAGASGSDERFVESYALLDGLNSFFRIYKNTIIDGDVGVGTASPSSELEVVGDVQATTLHLSAPTASRLAHFNASKSLTSTSMGAYLFGTANQVIVLSNADGTAELSTPQDLAATSDVTFNSITGDGSGLTNVDATTVDGLNSDQFLRSDTSDSFTIGTLTVGAGAFLAVADATATRPAAFDASSNLVSSSMASWLTGTANQITITDDLDGTVTLAAPQDLATSSSPTFANLTVTTSADIGNIDITSATITATSTNSDVTIAANGTGTLRSGTGATLYNGFTPGANQRTMPLSLCVGLTSNPLTNGIGFWENTNFGMFLGYDGTGTGDDNAIRIYSNTYSELFSFENGGNLGMGITAPTSKLHVYDASSLTATLQSGGAGVVSHELINTNGQWSIRQNSGSHRITIDDDTNSRIGFEIDSSGNITMAPAAGYVGIGKDGSTAATELDVNGTITSTGMAITGATASRLAAFDGTSKLVNTDLYSWVTETANQVLIANDGDGTVTFSLPQSIHTTADVQFTSVSVSDSYSGGSMTLLDLLEMGLVGVTDATIQGDAATGTDIDGADLRVRGGNSTGTGSSALRLQAAVGSTTGSTPNDAVDFIVCDGASDIVEVAKAMQLTPLTASRPIALDASKQIENTTFATWIAGTTNQVSVADDGDGSVTLSLPQNLDTSADLLLNSLITNDYILAQGILYGLDGVSLGVPEDAEQSIIAASANQPDANGCSLGIAAGGSNDIGYSKVSLRAAVAGAAASGSHSAEDFLVCDGQNGVVAVAKPITVGDLQLTDDTISNTVSNGNIVLVPNGTGSVEVFDPPAAEASGIDINGTTYNTAFRVNDIGGNAPAEVIIHRHSTTTPSAIVAARSNTNDDTHGALTAGQNILRLIGAGWTGTHYDMFGEIVIGADSSGTISGTSSPGAMEFRVTPDASNTPVVFMSADNAGDVTFANDITVSGNADFSTTSTFTGTATFNGTVDLNGNLTIADTSIAFDGASTNFATTGDFSINTSQMTLAKSTGHTTWSGDEHAFGRSSLEYGSVQLTGPNAGHTQLILGDIATDRAAVVQVSDNTYRCFFGANLRDDPSTSWGKFSASRGGGAVDVIGSTTYGMARMIALPPSQTTYSGVDIAVYAYKTNSSSYLSLDPYGTFFVAMGHTSPATQLDVEGAGATPVTINRLTNDGVLIDFKQADVSEGNISVSGSTVSYNGWIGSDFCWPDEPVELGDVLEMTGNNLSTREDGTGEIVFGVRKARSASAYIGVYLSRLEPSQTGDYLDDTNIIKARKQRWASENERIVVPPESYRTVVDVVEEPIYVDGPPEQVDTTYDIDPETGDIVRADITRKTKIQAGTKMVRRLRDGYRVDKDTGEVYKETTIADAPEPTIVRRRNSHLVVTGGNPQIKVNGAGGNLVAGDKLTVSTVAGVATKAGPGDIAICTCAENVTFATARETKLVHCLMRVI